MKTILVVLGLLFSFQAFAISQSAQSVRTVYSSTPVTTAAYVQIIASLPFAVSHVNIFDSSGQTLVLAVGAAGFEVDTILIPPGGIADRLGISAGQRVSIKAVSNNATTGEQDANFFY